MEKLKCKVVMLPTEKASYLTHRAADGELMYSYKLFANHGETINTNQYLYFTSKREIKEGDFFLDGTTIYSTPNERTLKAINVDDRACFKIEATTDPSLELPLIPQSFIEKYVEKQGKIDEVMIDINEIEDVESLSNYDENEIWLNGELMMCYDHRITTGRDKYLATIPFIKTRPDNTVIVSKVKDTWTRDEVIELIGKYDEKFAHTSMATFSEWINNNL